MTKKRINKKKRLSRKIQKGGILTQKTLNLQQSKILGKKKLDYTSQSFLDPTNFSPKSSTVVEPITSLFYELKNPPEGDELMQKSMAFQFLVDAVYNKQYPDNDIRRYFYKSGVERSISFDFMDEFLEIIVVEKKKISDELYIGDKSDIFYKLLTIIYYLLPYLEDESLESPDLERKTSSVMKIKAMFLTPLVATLNKLLN